MLNLDELQRRRRRRRQAASAVDVVSELGHAERTGPDLELDAEWLDVEGLDLALGPQQRAHALTLLLPQVRVRAQGTVRVEAQIVALGAEILAGEGTLEATHDLSSQLVARCRLQACDSQRTYLTRCRAIGDGTAALIFTRAAPGQLWASLC